MESGVMLRDLPRISRCCIRATILRFFLDVLRLRSSVRVPFTDERIEARPMVRYRRNRVAGATYFFTVTLRNRESDALVQYWPELRKALAHTHKRLPFRTDAMVVLPDHLHALWTLPAEDDDYPNRWRMLKAYFVRLLRDNGESMVKNSKGEYALWQRRYWEHTIQNDRDLSAHVDYIHYNPVKHGLVTHARAWPYSTFHRYVRKGMLSVDWGGSVNAQGVNGQYGE